MFHSLALNNKIDTLYERCLRIIYNNQTCNERLEKHNSASILCRNIQVLANEMFKGATKI